MSLTLTLTQSLILPAILTQAIDSSVSGTCRQWAGFVRWMLAAAVFKGSDLSERGVRWLRSTRVPLWRIGFAVRADGRVDHASALLLTDPEALPASVQTLKVCVSRRGLPSGEVYLLAES